MGLAEYRQVEISLGKLCEFGFDVEDAVFSIQMVLFELFKGENMYVEADIILQNYIQILS